MGPLRVMFLVVEDPNIEDPLREPILKENTREKFEEKPLAADINELKLINSLSVQRVPIDDNAKVLYTYGERGERNFYGGLYPQPYTLTPEKTLYTFYPKNA